MGVDLADKNQVLIASNRLRNLIILPDEERDQTQHLAKEFVELVKLPTQFFLIVAETHLTCNEPAVKVKKLWKYMRSLMSDDGDSEPSDQRDAQIKRDCEMRDDVKEFAKDTEGGKGFKAAIIATLLKANRWNVINVAFHLLQRKNGDLSKEACGNGIQLMKEYAELIELPPSYPELMTNDLLGLNPEDRIRRLKGLSREDLKNIMIQVVNRIDDDDEAVQLVAKVLQERRKVEDLERR